MENDENVEDIPHVGRLSKRAKFVPKKFLEDYEYDVERLVRVSGKASKKTPESLKRSNIFEEANKSVSKKRIKNRKSRKELGKEKSLKFQAITSAPQKKSKINPSTICSAVTGTEIGVKFIPNLISEDKDKAGVHSFWSTLYPLQPSSINVIRFCFL